MRATLLFLGVVLVSACKKAPVEAPVAQAPPPPVIEQILPEIRVAEPVVPARVELGTAYFDYDSYTLRPDTRAVLAENARQLQANPALRVRLEGHCVERGTTEYNLALGDRRAASARDYLVSLGVAPTRLDTVSYGEERPVAFGHDEDSWARNRRVEFPVPGDEDAIAVGP